MNTRRNFLTSSLAALVAWLLPWRAKAQATPLASHTRLTSPVTPLRPFYFVQEADSPGVLFLGDSISHRSPSVCVSSGPNGDTVTLLFDGREVDRISYGRRLTPEELDAIENSHFARYGYRISDRRQSLSADESAATLAYYRRQHGV